MSMRTLTTSLSLIIFSLYIIGVFHNLTKNNKNDCDMTYMFEYPQFVRIHVPENNNYIQYRLYAYSEGRYTEKARKMKFDGIPVLFLPGNAGSYKQVRSLASVALRKAISTYNHNVHFDYFTVDYNDELSGLFGGILMKQTEFARYCLKTILKLYGDPIIKSEKQPRSVVIIGHSMGGIIAKGVLNNDTFDSIHLILTLAAPLEAPVLNLDYYIHDYYSKVSDIWKSNNVSENKVLISIGGGPNDLLMPSAFVSSPVADLQSLTTSIPGVWLTTDHRSIMWCRQLVLVLNRFLFSIIDWKTKQITLDQDKIIQDANYFIKRRKRDKLLFSSNPLSLAEGKLWYEDSRRQYSLQFDKGIADIYYYMIRLTDLPNYQHLIVTATDIDANDWIFGCTASSVNANSRVCVEGTSLKHAITWLSAEKNHGRRQKVSLDLHHTAKLNPTWTHIIIKLTPSRKPVQLNVDVHNKDSRGTSVYVTSIYNNMKYTIVEITEAEAIYYKIEFSGFDSLHQAYLLYVEPIDMCAGSSYHVTAEMTVPWAEGHESVHHFTEMDKNPMRLFLLKEKVQNIKANVIIELFLDPKCRYKISYAGSIYEGAGQFSRHYTPSLISFIAIIALNVAQTTMTSIADGSKYKTTLSYYKALTNNNLKTFYLIVLSNIATRIIKSPALSLFSPTSIITTGFTLIVNQPYTIFVLPFFQFLIAFGAVVIIAALGQLSLLLSGQIAHKILIRMVWRGPGARGIAGIIRRVPGIAAAILTAIVPTSCGAVALTAGAVLYFFLLTRMYEDFIEEYFYRTILAFLKRLFQKSESYHSKENKNNITEITHYKQLEPQNQFKVVHTEKNINLQPAINENPHKDSIHREQTEIESVDQKVRDESKVMADIDTVTIQNDETEALTQHSSIDNKIVNTSEELCSLETTKYGLKDVSEVVPNIETLVPDVHINTPNIDKYVPDVQKAITDIDSLVTNIEKVTAVAEPNLNKHKSTVEPPQANASKDSRCEDATCGLHFHFMMFTLWCLVVALNVPSLLTWAHNFKYSMILQPDASFISGMIIIVSAGFLWQIDRPRRNLKYWKLLNLILSSFICLIMVCGSSMLFITNYLLSMSFALITAHQVFSNELQPDIRISHNTDDNLGSSIGQNSVPDNSMQFEKFVDLKEKFESNDVDS